MSEEIFEVPELPEDVEEKPKEKKTNVLWIILIVAVALILLCCCAAVIALLIFIPSSMDINGLFSTFIPVMGLI